MNYQKRNANKEEKLNMRFIETIFPFFMLNCALITLALTRKEGPFNMVFKTIGYCSYTYLIFMLYGEEQIFFKNAIQENALGYYIRAKYLKELPGQKHEELFTNLNNKFYTKNKSMEEHEIKKQLAIIYGIKP